MTIDLRGFGWRHAGRRAWALRGLDLRVEPGERVLLLGPSGSGKSTLLAALAGLLPAESGDREGELRVDGRPGIVFQDPSMQLVMARSGDDVAFGLENLGVPRQEIWPRVREALRAVGFPYGLERDTHALSGGEQQRLVLAGVLALRPDVLLLDEPTAVLDPGGSALVHDLLARAVASEMAMVLADHRVAEALPLVDRVIVLEEGAVRADGPPGRVFAERGAALAAAGVWVPGHAASVRRRGRRAPGDLLLSGRDLGFRYPRTGEPALRGAGVDVAAGEALGIVGANGSGKSTLALLLGGLAAPAAGEVTATAALAGRARARTPHRWPAPVLAARIGSVFQNPEHQFVTTRVDDELALGPRRLGLREPAVRAIVGELLERLRLDRLAAANPYTLSGGEQRRLSVATALATGPRLLVLDEPTFGQDLRTWTELAHLVADQRDAGHGVVLVTHDAAFVDAVADRSLTVRAGRTVAEAA